MNVGDLIEKLNKFDPEMNVYLFDGDEESYSCGNVLAEFNVFRFLACEFNGYIFKEDNLEDSKQSPVLLIGGPSHWANGVPQVGKP